MQYTVGGSFYKYYSIAFSILPGTAGGLALELRRSGIPLAIQRIARFPLSPGGALS
jgi:hypothetical protein